MICATRRLDDRSTAGAEASPACSRRRAAIRSPRILRCRATRCRCGVPAPAPPAAAAPATRGGGRLRRRDARTPLRGRPPVLMVDVEVRRFGLEAGWRPCAPLGIPVVTSLMGRGLLENADAPLVGTYLGLAGDPGGLGAGRGLRRAAAAGRHRLRHQLRGVGRARGPAARDPRVRPARVALAPHLFVRSRWRARGCAPRARASARLAARARPRSRPPRGLVRDHAPVVPLDVARAINDLMDAHGLMPVATDVGDGLFIAMDLVHTDYVAPGYYATWASACRPALGVQAATGRRPLALVGDGAFQMTGWSSASARRYGWDPIVVVLNNGEWGMLSRSGRRRATTRSARGNSRGSRMRSAGPATSCARGRSSRRRWKPPWRGPGVSTSSTCGSSRGRFRRRCAASPPRLRR